MSYNNHYVCPVLFPHQETPHADHDHDYQQEMRMPWKAIGTYREEGQ
jgi:hypothetical protein